MRLKKRAVSPIIATVILLGIAVVLGIIAMNWGRAHLETTAVCSIDTKMKIVEINNLPQVCYKPGEDGFIRLLVENGPNKEIEKLQLRVISKKQIYTTELPNSRIAVGSSFMTMVPYNSALFGEIKQIKITPQMIVYKNQPPVICTEQGIAIEEIRKCE